MGFLAKLFGNKASRDNKALQPILDKTLKAYEEVEKLDIDALRHKTVEFKEYVKNYVADEEARIKELKLKAENDDLDLEKKNEIYEQVDKLEKHQLEKIEEALNNIMPEAFAVSVKQLNLLAKLLSHSLTDKRVKLFGISYIAGNRFDSVLTSVMFTECKNFTLITVKNTFEVNTATNRPVDRICSDTKLFFELVEKFKRITGFSVEFIDECKID